MGEHSLTIEYISNLNRQYRNFMLKYIIPYCSHRKCQEKDKNFKSFQFSTYQCLNHEVQVFSLLFRWLLTNIYCHLVARCLSSRFWRNSNVSDSDLWARWSLSCLLPLRRVFTNNIGSLISNYIISYANTQLVRSSLKRRLSSWKNLS